MIFRLREKNITTVTGVRSENVAGNLKSYNGHMRAYKVRKFNKTYCYNFSIVKYDNFICIIIIA